MNRFIGFTAIMSKQIRNIFKKYNRRFLNRHNFHNFKNNRASWIIKSSFLSCLGKGLVIPKFGITKVIPNKEDIPKFIQEPLQYKDFLKKTSG